jgi:hypothetical protein
MRPLIGAPDSVCSDRGFLGKEFEAPLSLSIDEPRTWPRAALLRHTKVESAVRCLGIEVEDALELAEQTEA